jgi:DUF438 domain-containing protein
VSIHENIKRLIMTDTTIRAELRIYDHLLSTAMDTLSLVKKADQLVIKYQTKMQTAEAILKSAQDLLTPREWKSMLSGLDATPFRATSPASKEKVDARRSRDWIPYQKGPRSSQALIIISSVLASHAHWAYSPNSRGKVRPGRTGKHGSRTHPPAQRCPSQTVSISNRNRFSTDGGK